MSNLIDLTGKTFGRLTVIKRVGKDKFGHAMWECECSCGNPVHTIVSGDNLIRKHTTSCGCYLEENRKNGTNKNHGMYWSEYRLYTIWSGMRQRCNNPHSQAYHNYGGRGISVCPEWNDQKHGFKKFYDWSITHGYSKNLTIDRIDDNGSYEPGNCRWVDRMTQCNNTRKCLYSTYRGKTQSVSQWCRELDISMSLVQHRAAKYHIKSNKLLDMLFAQTQDDFDQYLRNKFVFE